MSYRSSMLRLACASLLVCVGCHDGTQPPDAQPIAESQPPAIATSLDVPSALARMRTFTETVRARSGIEVELATDDAGYLTFSATFTLAAMEKAFTDAALIGELGGAGPPARAGG